MIPTDVTDAADPRLGVYANLKDRQLMALTGAGDARGVGLFMAEGELVVRRLIESGLGVHSVLMTPTRLGTMRDAVDALPPGVPVYVTPPAVMESVTGFHIHRGVLAAGVRPPPADLDALLARATSLAILERLSNHDNVGGIFRTAAALGGERPAVLLSPDCCDPLYRKAIRVSMGAALSTPWAVLDPWPDALARVKAAGFTLVALTPGDGAVDLRRARLPARPALLLGAEGPGLDDATMALADLRVRIPISRAVDSLNVNVACGVAMAGLVTP